MKRRERLTFMTHDPTGFLDRVDLAGVDEPGLTLRDLLKSCAALSTQPLTEAHLDVLVTELRIDAVPPSGDLPVYLVPDMPWTQATTGIRTDPETVPGAATATDPAPAAAPACPPECPAPTGGHPRRINDREAVLLAHQSDIARAASYLEAGLSVLVRCEKLLVSHLAEEIAVLSGRRVRTVAAPAGAAAPGPLPGLPDVSGSRRNQSVDALIAAALKAEDGELVVVPHLDLLAGSTESTLSGEARELTDALYEAANCVLLGFIDPSLAVPEVLASRFAIRLEIDILPRLVSTDAGLVPVGQALVTAQEADIFSNFDVVDLYKHIAGLNAVRLRHALRFTAHQYSVDPKLARDEATGQKPPFRKLVAELQLFKAKTSNSFVVPNVSFEAIGGYDDVKAELLAALDIINGSGDLPDDLRNELVPRGFIFHGPPGTGKTLFAKAAASRLGATIIVVSGPEVTDKYVGESERKIRSLFAEARRNAPSVVVFDEFDSIAISRTGGGDGGSRAGNAIVAQLLTELDGFRPEVPVLIIGTTNRLDLIDEALLRPSRFRAIHIGLPELEARRAIAAYHADHFGVPVDDELLDAIAAATDRLSGDDVRSLFRDARAGEHTGAKLPADAYRLGQLVGQLRLGKQERQLARSTGRPAAPGPRRRLRDQAGS